MKKVLLIGITLLLMTSCDLFDGLLDSIYDTMDNPSELTIVTSSGEEHYVAGIEEVHENQGNWFFHYIWDYDWENEENNQRVGFYLSYYRTHLAGDKELRLELNSCNLSLPEVGVAYPIATQEFCNSLEGDYHGIDPTLIEWNGQTMYATEGSVTFTEVAIDDTGKGTLAATFELMVVDDQGNSYLIKDGSFTDAVCENSKNINLQSLYSNE